MPLASNSRGGSIFLGKQDNVGALPSSKLKQPREKRSNNVNKVATSAAFEAKRNGMEARLKTAAVTPATSNRGHPVGGLGRRAYTQLEMSSSSRPPLQPPIMHNQHHQRFYGLEVHQQHTQHKRAFADLLLPNKVRVRPTYFFFFTIISFQYLFTLASTFFLKKCNTFHSKSLFFEMHPGSPLFSGPRLTYVTTLEEGPFWPIQLRKSKNFFRDKSAVFLQIKERAIFLSQISFFFDEFMARQKCMLQ